MRRFSSVTTLVRLPWFLLAGIAVLSGCRGPQAPDPSMTAVRSGAGGPGSGSADWISQQDVDRANDLGLDMRDQAFGSDAMGNRIENLFEPVYFDFDQSFVRPADRGNLQKAAAYLMENPTARLLVEGHADWRGTTEYNMTLGDRRANSVSSYLEQIGVMADRLETVTKGDLEATTEGSDSQMQLDRRADLIVILP
jgi:peptidoglycan-associated lipoprotein